MSSNLLRHMMEQNLKAVYGCVQWMKKHHTLTHHPTADNGDHTAQHRITLLSLPLICFFSQFKSSLYIYFSSSISTVRVVYVYDIAFSYFVSLYHISFLDWLICFCLYWCRSFPLMSDKVLPRVRCREREKERERERERERESLVVMEEGGGSDC
ncbi:hypothetical protein VNO77_05771 [Canavalia gladiata]|uniref:Uncharacterized protein n=1 Tax=Canavalia gladiata TaxID=3824 RepID=A0AAN9N472_CANGL